MGQAVATPGNGLPRGAALIQPELPGEPSIAAVRIGSEDSTYSDDLSPIAGRLDTLAQEQVRLKSNIENRWLEDMRAYHGIYAKSDLENWKEAGQSYAFVKATRAKTVTLEARLFDLIFPTDDRNWGIAATPVPKLSDERREAEQRATNAAQQATIAEVNGQPQKAQQIVAAGNDEASRASAASGEIAKAERSAKLMQEEMDDQLIESHYPTQSRLLIHDACQLGTGILKGPMVNEQTRGRWLPEEGTENVFKLQQKEDARPLFRRVDPWSFFPDMSAATIEEAEFTFERYLWTKSDLRKMVKTHSFNEEAVRELLRDGRSNKPNTSPSLNNLVSLRSLTDDSAGTITGRYVGWEYHGPLECEDIVTVLRAQGRQEEADQFSLDDDPLKEYRVIVYICEGVILKLAPEYPLDSNETLYSLYNIEESEGSMFGYGIPRIMRDQQIALNASWRMALDNGALSVGPQGMIDKTQIEPADGKWTFVPKKIWWRIKSAVAGVTASPVEFFNVPNNMGEIKMLLELASLFIDLETGIPQPQQGEQGSHTTQTVGGMAILQNAANIIFRRMVKNYDDQMITPSMRRLYDWNMQFSTRPEIKGDMQVDARGTSVLLLKEVQATNLMIIVTQLLANPNVAPMLESYGLVEKLFQAMMIKPSEVMVEFEKFEAWMKKQAETPPPPSPQQIAAEARIESARIAAEVKNSSDTVMLAIAEMRERTAMIELAQKGEITIEELKALVTTKRMEIDSKERSLVTEAAIDSKNAREARERGDEPGGSGGNFNAGDDDNG